MSPLQSVSPGVNELALVVRAGGHLLACLVAVAVCGGAAGRPIRPVRAVAGGVALAVAFPILVFGAHDLGVLAPVADAAGNVLGTYAVAVAVPSLAAVAVAQAVLDGDVSDPRYASLLAGIRAQLSRDDAVGVFVATVALLLGELATLAVAATV